MTWTYKITDAGNCSVYDHNGEHMTTVMNDGSGIELPNDVLDVMHSELLAALDAGNSQRAIAVAADAACEQIKEVDN